MFVFYGKRRKRRQWGKIYIFYDGLIVLGKMYGTWRHTKMLRKGKEKVVLSC